MPKKWLTSVFNATAASALIAVSFAAGVVYQEGEASKELENLRLESLRTTMDFERQIDQHKASIDLLRDEIEATNGFYAKSLGSLKHEVLIAQAKLDHIFSSTVLSEGWSGYPEAVAMNEPFKEDFGFSGRVKELRNRTNRLVEHADMIKDVVLHMKLESNQVITGSPITRGWLSSQFGYRKDPFTGKRKWHSGIDLAGANGDEIKATAAGVVTFSGNMWGYGNIVVIEHENDYKTRYAHCQDLVVKVGDIVQKGQTVALMGSTGRSTGPHVHYEVVKGYTKVDPEPYIKRGEIL